MTYNKEQELKDHKAMRLACSQLLYALQREHPDKLKELDKCKQLRKEIDLCRPKKPAPLRY